MAESDAIKCLDVNSLNTTFAKCNFTQTTPDCHYDGIVYDFTHLVYCDIGDNYRGVSFVVLLSLILVLFIAMAVVADDFLCSSLLTISKTLRMPDSIAGVTFLAFGNGAPDIFSVVSGVRSSKPELVIGSLFGAGIFVTTVVAGSVLMVGQFEAMRRPLIRDIVFYIGTSCMVWYMVSQTRIYLTNAIVLVVLYICYILVVIFGHYFYMKTKKGRQQQTDSCKDLSIISDVMMDMSEGFDTNMFDKKQSSDTLGETDVVLSRFYTPKTRNSSLNSELTVHGKIAQTNELNNNDESYVTQSKPNAMSTQMPTKSSLYVEVAKKALSETHEFFTHIIPVDVNEWPEYRWYNKAFECIKAVPQLLYTVCIPVVDLERPKQNWCRPVICVNTVCAPQIILFFLKLTDTTVNGFPIWALMLIISMVASVVIYMTSTREEPPIYHRVFAFIGFGVSILFINSITDELVHVLETLGIMFSLSDGILGLTILAWGNSIGDFISNMSVARNGYLSIAISASFGEPILNLLLGLGLPYIVLLVDEPAGLELVYNRMVTLLCTTSIVSLVSSLVLFVVFRFKSNRIHGIYLLCIYLVYIVIAVLFESEIF